MNLGPIGLVVDNLSRLSVIYRQMYEHKCRMRQLISADFVPVPLITILKLSQTGNSKLQIWHGLEG